MSIFLPFLDNLILNFEIQFEQNNSLHSSIEIVFPKYASRTITSQKLKNQNILHKHQVSEKIMTPE